MVATKPVALSQPYLPVCVAVMEFENEYDNTTNELWHITDLSRKETELEMVSFLTQNENSECVVEIYLMCNSILAMKMIA